MQQIRLLHRSIHSRIEEVFCYRTLDIELWIFEYPKSEARHSEYEVSNWTFSYIDGLSTAEDIKMCAPNVWLKHQLTTPNITLQIDFNESQLTQFMQHFTGVQNIYNMKDNESIWYQWGLRPRQYCPPVRISRCIFLNENVWILPETSQKFVSKLRINNISAYNGLVPTRWQAIILNSYGQFVTRPQWVNYKNALISEIWPLSIYGVGCSVLTRTYPLPVVGHFTE